MTRTIQVKGYTRKSRKGKSIQVKGYTRKYTPRNKTMEATKVEPGDELLKKKVDAVNPEPPKKSKPKDDWGPTPKWTAEDYQIQKETAGMSLWQMQQYMKKRKQMQAQQKPQQPKRSFLSKLFKSK